VVNGNGSNMRIGEFHDGRKNFTVLITITDNGGLAAQNSWLGAKVGSCRALSQHS